MSRVKAVRRLATGVAYACGGVGLTGGVLVAVLRGEARAARRRVEAGRQPDPPSGDGSYGRGRGTPISFTVLGDSSAVGLGVDRAGETPGVLVAAALTELAERPVRLTRLAVSGARSPELDAQVDTALLDPPDVALIMIGANDVTSRMRPALSVRHLGDAVRRLTAAGTEVVVGTCPDLGTIRPIGQPLRTLARHWSRQMATAQTIAVVEAGGRTVSLGSALGPSFATDRSLFSRDEFHPSAAGYAQAAAVILPSVADALGVWPASADRRRGPLRRDAVRPVVYAAVRAASRTGSEVQPAESTGPRGGWALLRRHRHPEIPTPAQAAQAEQEPAAR